MIPSWPTSPITVEVPATSANLGPGFDSLGIALSLVDTVSVEVVEAPGVQVSIEGHGAGTLPADHTHLVASTLLSALVASGVQPPGLRLACINRIPHGRGLGSSAAAIVAGVALARAVAGDVPEALDDQRSLELAAAIEGHPDNIAPALLGGFTIAWRASQGYRAVSCQVHPSVRPVVCIPSGVVSTKAARGLLPVSVPHEDAASNAARAALLVHAVTTDPSLLLDATEDRLHQEYRAAAMPETIELVSRLRARGLPAVVSGSGPTVLVLGQGDRADEVRECARGFDVHALSIESVGAHVLHG